jgi:hypothetical protein
MVIIPQLPRTQTQQSRAFSSRLDAQTEKMTIFELQKVRSFFCRYNGRNNHKTRQNNTRHRTKTGQDKTRQDKTKGDTTKLDKARHTKDRTMTNQDKTRQKKPSQDQTRQQPFPSLTVNLCFCFPLCKFLDSMDIDHSQCQSREDLIDLIPTTEKTIAKMDLAGISTEDMIKAMVAEGGSAADLEKLSRTDLENTFQQYTQLWMRRG